MKDARRQSVVALLATIDQAIADAEALAAQSATVEMRQLREMILKDLQDTRKATEALLCPASVGTGILLRSALC